MRRNVASGEQGQGERHGGHREAQGLWDTGRRRGGARRGRCRRHRDRLRRAPHDRGVRVGGGEGGGRGRPDRRRNLVPGAPPAALAIRRFSWTAKERLTRRCRAIRPGYASGTVARRLVTVMLNVPFEARKKGAVLPTSSSWSVSPAGTT